MANPSLFDASPNVAAASADAGFLDAPDSYEIIHGHRVEIPPMSAYGAKLASRLVTNLGRDSGPQGLGEAVVETLFRLPLTEDRTRNRRPDVAFVSAERWPVGQPQPKTENAWNVVPDLAVEVLSPHDRAEEILEKISDYFRSGVRLVWVISPVLSQVYVFETATAVRVLSASDDLDGGAVLPEFRLALSQLFDRDTPPRSDAPASS